MYMDYMMFLERLAEEASKVAKENKQTKVTNDDIMKVAKVNVIYILSRMLLLNCLTFFFFLYLQDVLHEFHG